MHVVEAHVAGCGVVVVGADVVHQAGSATSARQFFGHHAQGQRHGVGGLASAVVAASLRVEELGVEGGRARSAPAASNAAGVLGLIRAACAILLSVRQVLVVSRGRGDIQASQLGYAGRLGTDVVPIAQPIRRPCRVGLCPPGSRRSVSCSS